MKIRAKILSYIIPLVLLPPVIVTLVAFLWANQISHHTQGFNRSVETISSALKHATDNVNSIFNERLRNDYEFIAENTAGTLKLINTFVEREIHQLALSTALESYMTISGAGRDFIAPKVFTQLYNASGRSGFLSISIFDTNGVSLLQYPINAPVPTVKLPEDKLGWKVYHSHQQGPPATMNYIAPLRYDGLRVNPDKGVLAGWLVVDFPFSNFVDQLTSVTTTNSLHMILLDNHGGLLFKPEGIDLLDDPNNTLAIRRNIIPEQLDVEFLIPWKEILETTRETTTLLASLEQETDNARRISKQADEFVVKAIMPFSLTLLVVIILAALAGGHLSKTVTTPILQLSEVAGQLSAGNLEITPELSGNDEVAELSRSLDRMRLSLRDHINNLDRLVSAKTNDLNAKTEALAASERETRELITRMTDAFVLLEVYQDVAPRILFCNPAFNTLAENRTSTRPIPYLSESQYERCLNVAHSGVTERFDVETEDGQAFSYNMYSPSPNRLAVVITNFTHRSKAEKESRRIEDAVRHTQKLESLGVLAGGIAHDFNNLLMAIMGNADLALLDAIPGSEIQENLMEIQKSSMRAANLCKQMLAYSGKGRFVIESCDISQLINDMIQLINVSVPKNVELSYNFAPELPLVEADTTQIRQVILNLVTNASEAMNDAEGKIYIRTRAEELPATSVGDNPAGIELAAGVYASIEVEDNGCGMSEETLKHVFEPFFTTKMTGRGLGMSAILGIVRAHKGLIRIHSEEGKGTRITLSFPAIAGAVAANKAISGTVLIVDDDMELSSVLERMLQKSGADTQIATSGQEAYAAYTTTPDQYSYLFISHRVALDDRTPLVRALMAFNPNVKIVIVSNRSENEALIPFKDLPVAAFLQKPYHLSRIKSLLHRFSLATS